MALTRPRASQIYDIDYKQATRVITVTNVTLSGGAPSQVDGVNLSLDDRVLVTGQSNRAQNGIYFVDTVGSGSNGTWVRSSDTNSTGELLAGTIVMVTEGTTYHDTQWKLVTDDPIVIGTSELIFEQNSAFAFGNVYANGTAVLATSVGDVLTLTAGDNISISGNNTSKTVTVGVTGISLNSISNGTSNVNVVSSGGNVTVGIGGTSNVAVFGSTGANITGTLGVSGNVTGGNLITAGQITATGNITGGNILTGGNIVDTVGAISIVSVASGNVNLAPNGTNVVIATTSGANITGTLGVTGNITGGNLSGTSIVGTLTTASQTNITSVGTLGSLAVTGNITSGNISGTRGVFTNLVGTLETASQPNITTVGTLGSLTVTGNISSGNLAVTNNVTINGNLSVTGNATLSGNILGDRIQNGTTSIDIQTASGNANITIGGTSNVVVFSTAGANISGYVTATGNITGGNILGNGAGLSGINAFSTIAVTGGNSAVADSIADTLTITAGSGIALVMDSTTDTLTIAASSGSDIFVDGADFGTVTEAVTASDDLGLVTDAVTAESDLGTIVTSGILYPDQLVLPSYTTSNLPSASAPGSMIFVTNEAGGAVPAFADGTNWRRVTDRAIIS